MKKFIIWLVVIIIIVVGAYLLLKSPSNNPEVTNNSDVTTDVASSTVDQNATTTPENPGESVIGQSVEGRDIIAYHYGTGDTEVLFVGGIHGSYEWNTGAVAYDLVDYLKANPEVIPANVKVTVVPVLNPDGMVLGNGTTVIRSLSDVSGVSSDVLTSGRFNANKVDLNRNFDCDWKTNATWQNKAVSGGSAAFSEPESLAIKNYIETKKPTAVIVWYSAAGGVFSSSCHNGILPETNTLTNTFAKASGYPAHESFDFYATTGDMVNWLAKEKIPAISVLLTNHNDVEWSKNQAGVEAILKYYAK